MLQFRFEVGFVDHGLCSRVHVFLDYGCAAVFTVEPGRCWTGHDRRVGFFQRQLTCLLLTDRLVKVTVTVVGVGSAFDLPCALGPLPAQFLSSFLSVGRANLERLHRTLQHELWQLLAHDRLL